MNKKKFSVISTTQATLQTNFLTPANVLSNSSNVLNYLHSINSSDFDYGIFNNFDNESKSNNRSINCKQYMEYSSIINIRTRLAETMKKQFFMNGNSQPYLSHDACAAQVRTIMKAAGLMPDKVTGKLKMPRSSYFNPSQHKMTLMAELFASEEEEENDEENANTDNMYDSDVNDDLANSAQLDNEDFQAEYEEEDEEDDDHLDADAGEDGDDEEEENSEVSCEKEFFNFV